MASKAYEVRACDPEARASVWFEAGLFGYLIETPEGDRFSSEESEPLHHLHELVGATLADIEWAREGTVLRTLEAEAHDRRSRKVAQVLATALR